MQEDTPTQPDGASPSPKRRYLALLARAKDQAGKPEGELCRKLAARLALKHPEVIVFGVEWRPEHKGWRASWWLTMDAGSFPVGSGDGDGHHAVLAKCRDQYVGDLPPADHGSIWGGYECSDCGASNVRLWRDYQTFLDSQTLRCRTCALEHEDKPADWAARGDQIGWSVPAVPTADGSTFWGYTSAPLLAALWWQALDTVPS